MKTVARRDFLNLLAKSNTPRRRRLLTEWADKADMDALSEISFNTLKGNIKLSPQMHKKLKRYRGAIRTLASKKSSLSKKKSVVKQHGGFMSSLIPLALAAVTSLVPELIKGLKRKK